MEAFQTKNNDQQKEKTGHSQSKNKKIAEHLDFSFWSFHSHIFLSCRPAFQPSQKDHIIAH